MLMADSSAFARPPALIRVWWRASVVGGSFLVRWQAAVSSGSFAVRLCKFSCLLKPTYSALSFPPNQKHELWSPESSPDLIHTPQNRIQIEPRRLAEAFRRELQIQASRNEATNHCFKLFSDCFGIMSLVLFCFTFQTSYLLGQKVSNFYPSVKGQSRY